MKVFARCLKAQTICERNTKKAAGLLAERAFAFVSAA